MHLSSPLAAPLGGDLSPGLTEAEKDVFDLILSLYPPGARSDLYAIDVPGPSQSDVGRFFEALAQCVNAYAASQVAGLRVELDPSRATEKLADWEAALALPITRHPPTTTAGRQAAVVAKLRESGSYTLPNLRAIVGPLLGYADPTALEIVETDRAALRAAHTYQGAAAISVSGVATQVDATVVADDGVVSSAGARVSLPNFNATNYSGAYVTITLTAPDGRSHAWPTGGATGELWSPPGTAPLVLWAYDLAGARVNGVWTLTVANTLGGNTVTADSWNLFVEGARLDSAGYSGLGGAVFEFAAYANPALVGAAAPADHAAARAALRRAKPAHTASAVIKTKAPVPGALAPGEFIPKNN